MLDGDYLPNLIIVRSIRTSISNMYIQVTEDGNFSSIVGKGSSY